MSIPVHSAPLDLVTTAVLELLRGAGRAVFDATYARVPELEDEDPAYAADPLSPVYPYGVLYRIPGGSADPFPDLERDPREVTLVYQVTAVSNLRNQCERTGSQFHDQVLARTAGDWAHPIAVPPGWQVVDRRPDDVMPGIDRSGSPPTAVFSLPFRFHLTIAPD